MDRGFGRPYQLCVNSDILNEYEEILAEKTTPEIAHNVVEAIARMHTTVFQEVYIHFGLIEADADDNKFVDCAVAADAEYIVTNDTHFNILKHVDWPRLTVIKKKRMRRLISGMGRRTILFAQDGLVVKVTS